MKIACFQSGLNINNQNMRIENKIMYQYYFEELNYKSLQFIINQDYCSR